jgi:hypothetical protein
MGLYVEAADLVRHMPAGSDDLASVYGNAAMREAIQVADLERQLGPVFKRLRNPRILEMGPQSRAQDDEVLAYLRSRGLPNTTTKAARDNFKRWHERPSGEIPVNMRVPPDLRRDSAEDFIKQFKHRKGRCTIDRFPEPLLTRAAEYTKWNNHQSRGRGAATKLGQKAPQAKTSETNQDAERPSGSARSARSATQPELKQSR